MAIAAGGLAVTAGIAAPAAAGVQVRVVGHVGPLRSRAWYRVPSPDPHGDADLSGVSCSSDSACTAVGSASTGIAPVHVSDRGRAGDGFGIATTSSGTSSLTSSAGLVRRIDASARFALLARLGLPAVGELSRARSGRYHEYAVAERWDGRRWSLQPTPAVLHNELVSLGSVSCPSADVCMAIGAAIDAGDGQMRAISELWNGTSWRLVALPAEGPVVASVSCPTATSCLAVGTDDESGSAKTHTTQLADRWDGHGWRIIRLAPSPLGGLPFLDAVSCPSVADCTVAGTLVELLTSPDGHLRIIDIPDAQHWDGRGWSDEHLPAPMGAEEVAIDAIGCAAGRSCVAVGGVVTSDGGTSNVHPLVEAWNGRVWRHQVGAHPGAFLDGASCPAAGTCTAVGDRTIGRDGIERTWIERTDGPRWVVEPNPTGPPGMRNLAGVTCSATACEAVGSTSAGSLIERRQIP